MTKSGITIKALASLMFTLALCSTAQAQSRVFVSGTGSDVNPCTRTSPCRNFQRGHDAVAPGGEVVALDSAGYGTLSITKSVTITGAGVHAAITAPGPAYGVLINATGKTVILRELTITGGGTGDSGVLVADAATVYIERCVITSFAGSGIIYQTNNRLFITDTVSRSNGTGLDVFSFPGGTARINVDGSRFEQNFFSGIVLDERSIEATITNSIMSENGGAGFGIFRTVPSSTGNTRANVAHSTAANNGGDGFFVGGVGANQLNIEYSVARGNGGSGMIVQDGDIIRVSNSVATNNGTGFNNQGGTFESRGNNTVAGNTNLNVGVITPLTAQ